MITNKQIKQIIEKAHKNGYNISDRYFGNHKEANDEVMVYFTTYRDYFNHDFAKAFWGTLPCMLNEYGEAIKEGARGKKGQIMQDWQYHLQQMVLEENPIKYLEKFL